MAVVGDGGCHRDYCHSTAVIDVVVASCLLVMVVARAVAVMNRDLKLEREEIEEKIEEIVMVVARVASSCWCGRCGCSSDGDCGGEGRIRVRVCKEMEERRKPGLRRKCRVI
uniref:Transmembrane protein n=1 Tax=Nelumbo nucifera TaxID=4432 RepID=A0A822ZTB3_NELNU|nr:TPA_asm: hypothetical protein HUJ06_019101 [Nelumbo nucifera]